VKPRTISVLQYRICVREERMRGILSRTDLTDDVKQRWSVIEQGVINEMKALLRQRTEWYLRCIGC